MPIQINPNGDRWCVVLTNLPHLPKLFVRARSLSNAMAVVPMVYRVPTSQGIGEGVHAVTKYQFDVAYCEDGLVIKRIALFGDNAIYEMDPALVPQKVIESAAVAEGSSSA